LVFRFGDYVLDIGRRELRRGAEPVALEPQVFDLLVYLALTTRLNAAARI
jgi:DNA-binding winged helix-turn-helix (wHTH) protein